MTQQGKEKGKAEERKKPRGPQMIMKTPHQDGKEPSHRREKQEMRREMREELKVRPKTALRVRRSEGETDQEEGRKKTE